MFERGTIMTGRLIIMWAIVGIPLIWGISKTLENAMKLFA
jgi:hypothetical protein